jgi:Zn-dependent protease
MEINVIIQIAILVFSVIIHEVSHGAMALAFGDRTAEYEGRLTLNPVRHIDIFGSVLLPLFLFISHAGFMIGWAKPVPYNPYNLRNRKIAEPLVAFAGPLSNIIVATFFGLLIRYIPVSSAQILSMLTIFANIVLVNLALAIFNLIPIPPLDGSKIIFSFLPAGRFAFTEWAAKYGLFILIIIVAFLPNFIVPVLNFFYHLITGLNLI